MSWLLPAPDPLWAPAFFTRSLNDVSDGAEITDFAASLLAAPRGFRADEPLVFTQWQRWLLDRVFERRADNGFLRYRRALIGVPRKQEKSLLGTSIAWQHLLFGPAGPHRQRILLPLIRVPRRTKPGRKA